MDPENTPLLLRLGWKLGAVFLAGALVGAVSAVEVVPHARGGAAVAQGLPGPSSGTGGTVSRSAGSSKGKTGDGGRAGKAGKPGSSAAIAGAGGTTSRSGGVSSTQASGLACDPAHNGGSTDQGVTGSQIKMATTVVKSGIGAAFLGDVQYAMEAARDQANRSGGVCGRQLSIQYVDDGWDANRGAQYLRNFIHEGVFAIPVGPSSEGLAVVIDSGDFDRAHIPVVGTDGLRADQYVNGDGRAQPWVWPVATSTVSSARIMADWAYKRGARHFSVVFDNDYKFGVEGAFAFNAEVRRLTGKTIDGYNPQKNCQRAFCGIVAGQSSYSSQVQQWKSNAGDFTALFLEPDTALTWMGDPNTPPASSHLYGAAQPMFTSAFASQCGTPCDQMWEWTGFKPDIEQYKNDPAVRDYVRALQETNPQADVDNAFAEGGYVGMQLLIQALQKVGPDLTRGRLQAALNGMCLQSGLTIQPKVCYSPGTRFANLTMQAFQIQYKGTFGGWRAGDVVRDTHPGAG